MRMQYNGREVRAMASPWRQCVEFLVRGTTEKGEHLYGAGRERQPTFTLLSYDDAQLLMDDLWNAGLRPTEGTGSAGSLKATERHLEDMRTLVFHGRTPRQSLKK